MDIWQYAKNTQQCRKLSLHNTKHSNIWQLILVLMKKGILTLKKIKVKHQKRKGNKKPKKKKGIILWRKVFKVLDTIHRIKSVMVTNVMILKGKTLWDSWVWKTFCSPFLVCKLQPPWSSLHSKGQIANQVRSSHKTIWGKIKGARDTHPEPVHALILSATPPTLIHCYKTPHQTLPGWGTSFSEADAHCVFLFLAKQ